MSNDSNDNSLRRALASQSRRFDSDVANLRSFYVGLAPDERARFRHWIERVAEVECEGNIWEAFLRIHVQNDVYDEKGELLRWADAAFTPGTMLAAVRAWDAGESYAPPGIRP